MSMYGGGGGSFCVLHCQRKGEKGFVGFSILDRLASLEPREDIVRGQTASPVLVQTGESNEEKIENDNFSLVCSRVGKVEGTSPTRH